MPSRFKLAAAALLAAIALLPLLPSRLHAEQMQGATQDLPDFRPLSFTEIPGAVRLQQPRWVSGLQHELRTEKHGLVYPALYDWDGDGKQDLLLGEFETGEEGSYIQVHLNTGTAAAPAFSGEFFYATDTAGNKITNHQWCCIGIHPRLVDLDNDGHVDILSGQYNPGKISWWRGSPEGFLPRQFVQQEGYVEGGRLSLSDPPWKPTANSYWNYTSVDFADFDGDGLLDLFVGGSDGLRFARNEGTAAEPKFGLRQSLLGTDGQPLNLVPIKEKQREESRAQGRYLNPAGVFKSYVTPIDYNGDTVVDLLVTYGFNKAGHQAIEYFQGVKTKFGTRFLAAQPLFGVAAEQKELPGCQPMLHVCDYNHDGIRDLLVGISVPTVNGLQADATVAWDFLGNLGLNSPGKDAGRSLKYYGGAAGALEKMKEQPYLRNYLLGKMKDEKYLTLRHRGYVFVMLGQSPETKAAPASEHAAVASVARQELKNEVAQTNDSDDAVALRVSIPERIYLNKTQQVQVQLDFADNWHGYSNTPQNKAEGRIPVTVKIEFPAGLETAGPMEEPIASPILEGKGITIRQKFRCPYRRGMKQEDIPWESKIRVIVGYQVCDDRLCLPPQTQEFEFDSKVVYQ